MQAPSKKIITLIAFAVIVVGAVGINKFWPSPTGITVVSPEYNAAPASAGAALPLPKGIDGTAFLQSFATSSEATTTDDTPDTASREIARALFANAVYLENSNSLDNTGKEALVANAISQIQNSFTYRQYDASGISYENENLDAIRQYATSFATQQISMIVEMQLRVGEIQQDLGTLGEIYAKQADAIYAIPVTATLAETHLAIVNDFSKAAAAFRAFGNEKNDPLLLPVAIGVYDSAATELEKLLRSVAQYMTVNGIIFTSAEAGGYWNAFLQ